MLQEAFDEAACKSNLLFFLTKQLDINFHQEPLVEATIQEGKINWRIVTNAQVLYTRQKEFNFAHTNPWRMTWEQFRLFKDSGKRSGTVAITLKRFLQCLPKQHQEQATAVWQELKNKNILTDKNRLSDGWRVIAGNQIELDTLTNFPLIIEKKMSQSA